MRPGSDAEYESGLRSKVRHFFPLLRNYVRRMSDKGSGLLTCVS